MCRVTSLRRVLLNRRATIDLLFKATAIELYLHTVHSKFVMVYHINNLMSMYELHLRVWLKSEGIRKKMIFFRTYWTMHASEWISRLNGSCFLVKTRAPFTQKVSLFYLLRSWLFLRRHPPIFSSPASILLFSVVVVAIVVTITIIGHHKKWWMTLTKCNDVSVCVR